MTTKYKNHKKMMTQLLAGSYGVVRRRAKRILQKSSMDRVSCLDPQGAKRFWEEVLIVANQTLKENPSDP